MLAPGLAPPLRTPSETNATQLRLCSQPRWPLPLAGSLFHRASAHHAATTRCTGSLGQARGTHQTFKRRQTTNLDTKNSPAHTGWRWEGLTKSQRGATKNTHRRQGIAAEFMAGRTREGGEGVATGPTAAMDLHDRGPINQSINQPIHQLISQSINEQMN